MIKDNLNQEVNIGDWIATIPMGYKTVVIGKVTSITKDNNPKIKLTHKSPEQGVGKTVEHREEFNAKYIYPHNPTGKYWKQYLKPHFIKVIPTREIELNYENV